MSKCYIGMHALSPRTDAMHNWNWYGRISYPQWRNVFLDNAAWANHSTYHTVLKASPGAAIFGQDMLFNILLIAELHIVGEYRQSLTDCSNQCKNTWRIDYDYDYKAADRVLMIKEGILRKVESTYGKEPWTITTFHRNGNIRIQCRTKTERLNIQ